jgi:pimeloyl-ACP methyl ester carboxylesterase
MKYTFKPSISETALGILSLNLTLIFLMVASCSAQQEAPPPPERYSMKQVTVEGTTISYFEKGNGNPIVLIHGIPTSSFLWRDMIEELSPHGRVIALDLPGFGFSDPPHDGDYGISNYAHLLERFLEALSIEQATLVCHDLGGPITLTYALRHPDKYDRLIILDTFLHRDLPPWPLSMRMAKIWPIGEIFMWLGGKSIIRTGLEEGVIDKSRISDGVVKRYYMSDGNPDKLNRSMLGTLRIDYMEDLEFIEKNLKTIQKPTLILWGEKDIYLPISLGNRIHKDITGSQMERIPNCGHYIPEDQPELATKIIVAFLNN